VATRSYGFITHISRQREETCAYHPERHLLDSLSLMFFRVHGHPPQQRSARYDFDKAIHTKTDEGNAASNDSGYNRDNSFEGVPGDSEILQPSSAQSHRLAS
jgi:hypothetical protein